MIHACGQVEAARHFIFSPDFVAAARAALNAGAPIFCDAEMVAHGVTRARLPAGNEVICTLRDPRTAALAAKIGNTRSAAAIELWGEKIAGSLVAIGNAPTALFYLLDKIRAGGPRPAAIIGMPVGFVGAAESKDALAAESLRHTFRHRARPHGRQRHDRSRHQRHCEGRPVTSNGSGRLYGVGTGPGDPELLTLKAVRALGEADVLAHFAKRGNNGNARKIIEAHLRPEMIELPLLYPVTTEIDKDHDDYKSAIGDFYAQSASAVEAHLSGGPHGRGAQRRRPAVLRLLHASACAARASLSDRGDPRRDRHVRLLVGDRHADRPGRRRAVGAARHHGRSRADAPPGRHRRRRHHEGRPQSAKNPPRA